MSAIAHVRARLASVRARRRLEAVGRGPRPIVAGPWRSEVGFELLYWIPLLRWFCAEHGIPRDDVVAVSRGGADSWYADVAGTYIDLLDYNEPADLIRERADRLASHESEKQSTVSDSDRTILAHVQAQAGAPESGLLHPSLMYRLFHIAWIGGAGHELTSRNTRHAAIVPPRLDDLDLPDDYVALKAYFSDCFPDNGRNREFLDQLVERLAERSAVVVLRTPTALDDHSSYEPIAAPGVVDASSLLNEPRRNLAVQTAIVGGARGLATTYGGFSYLGPLLGRETRSFFSTSSFNPHHVTAGLAAATGLGRSAKDATPVHVDDYAPPG